ncbi:hypothetical protein DCCM_0013 [Desulfocucumis palustris]|uniref:Uncharacterized protein n=1 Tax=Desulfocucumis palustris TaxID=1898651 RepID=A0A2L2X6S5_9FIRM|nr:hypothetical protein [Desulfocucumis palustris]GBF31829.1 hypothetical protein DCCM_0013 [Desulfocucumis palustris]
MLPCIKESSLSLFVATADQRFLLGEDIFLRTHFPVTMRRFRPGSGTIWSEGDLLRELESAPAATPSGNQTYVLYGAAGSGKSEVIRWLECNIRRAGSRPFALRISRTELDPVKILQKILSQFKGLSLNEAIYHQWEDLRKKPVTLANHLVWSALGKMLPSDSEIIPISYRLRPIIEDNLRLNFSGIDSPTEIEDRTPELISLEDLEELTRQSSISIDIECEQLRYLMARELEHAVLGGYNFVETLKSISQELMVREGIRPLLLIDDLVQSMNIYSTDLLDFFITMEEGNWDIVLGLTPASFESSKRGREILNRINTLDTFDDRLIKLWLTDDQGHDSYFINIKNCHLYAEKYLMECKRLTGFSCDGGCSLIKRCVALQMGLSQLPSLSPFNQALLARIYRSLPRGKGKARYFIAALGDILRSMVNGELSGALDSYIKREVSVDHPDPLVRLLGEVYAPDSSRKKGFVSIKGKALSALVGTTGDEFQDVEASIYDLSAARTHTPNKVDEPSGEFLEIDTSKAAVRDWLEGRQVNKELLKGLRLGISYLCRELAQPCNLIPRNTSRLTPLLRWDETVEGSKIPVSLEGVDIFEGIKVQRALGHAAYPLNYVHLKRGRARESSLESALQYDEIYYLFYAAQELKDNLHARLEKELGIPPDEFAYILFVLLMEVGQGGRESPILIQNTCLGESMAYPEDIAGLQVFFPEDIAQAIRALFKDWLLLRENIYDAVRLKKFMKKYKDVDPILELAKINPENISPQFKIGEIELSKFVNSIQIVLNELAGSARGESALKERWRLEKILEVLGELQHPGSHVEIQSLLLSVASSLGLPKPLLPDWQDCQKLHSRIRRGLRRFLGRAGRLEMGGPISAHRFMLSLGEIDRQSDYVAMKEIHRLFELAVSRIEGAGTELWAVAESIGVAGHLAISQYWGIDIVQPIKDGRWDLEYFTQLARRAQEVAISKRYLNCLEMASPYIDHQLAEEAEVVASILEIIISQNISPKFLNRIKVAMGQCREYSGSIEKILKLDGFNDSWDDLIPAIRDAHQRINGERLKGMLLNICQEWLAYIENLVQLAKCLGIAGGSLTVLCGQVAHILQGVEEKDEGAEIARALYEAGLHLKRLPGSAQIACQINGNQQADYLWLLDILLAPQSPEIALSSISLEGLHTFGQMYPALADAIKIKMYLSLSN